MAKEIVIGVPGFWESREEFKEELETFQKRFRLEGDYLVKEGGTIPLKLDWYDRDDNLGSAFRYAAQGRIEDSVLEEIDAHTYTAYVVCPVQSPAGVAAVVEASRALFSAGGIAIKVESAGIAHSEERWRELTDTFEPEKVIQAFVCLVGDSEGAFSCGMHNFGLPDTFLHESIGQEHLAVALTQANLYQLARPEVLRDGDLIQFGTNVGAFRAFLSVYEGYHPATNHYNPYGRWNLERAEDQILRGPDPKIAALIRILRDPSPAMRTMGLEEFERDSVELTVPLIKALERCIIDTDESVHIAAVQLVIQREEWVTSLYRALAGCLFQANMTTAMMIIPALAKAPEALPILFEVAQKGDSPGALFARMFLSNLSDEANK